MPCLLMFCSTGLAQETKHLDEVVVIASRTVNKPDGYITNLKGMNIVKGKPAALSLIHISEPTRLDVISYAVFCLKKKI